VGVDVTGFTLKTIEDLKAEIEADEKATIDAGLNVDPDQPIGQLNGIFSKRLAELWELAQVAYNGFDPAAAEGRLLDNVGALRGTARGSAKRSLVTCTVNLNNGFSASAGTMLAHVAGQDPQWRNRDAIGPVVGTGNYTLVFESVDYGPIAANAGTLAVITNPITGWNSITNALDAQLGNLVEKDPAYLARQEDELTAPGASTVDAIRTDLLEVKNVIQAFCYENTSWVTDGTGLPGKAIECVIYDGAVPTASNDEVAQAIWNSKPSGSQAYGVGASGTAIDKAGVERTIPFSRAEVKNVYLELDIKINTTTFPSNGVALVKDAVVAKGNELMLADEVVALAIRSAGLTITGVHDVVALRLGFTASPVGTVNLPITGRQIARFDTSRVVVNIV
jgi:uncharacterized phage protein gp47/JayE